MPQTITVKFIRNHGPYLKDSIATFPHLIGSKLIIYHNVAIEYVEPVVEAPKEPKKARALPERNTTKSIITK